jgi:flagellar hook-basal body complex protein FliE
MIVPVGAVGSLAGGLQPGAAQGLAQGSPAAQAEGLAQGAPAAGQTTPAEGLEPGAQASKGAEAVGGGSGGFGGALTEAISSLEGSQLSASSAAQGLATGTVKDPESAVVTVEDAQLTMDLASQLRTKATEAVQNIFQTQV